MTCSVAQISRVHHPMTVSTRLQGNLPRLISSTSSRVPTCICMIPQKTPPEQPSVTFDHLGCSWLSRGLNIEPLAEAASILYGACDVTAAGVCPILRAANTVLLPSGIFHCSQELPTQYQQDRRARAIWLCHDSSQESFALHACYSGETDFPSSHHWHQSFGIGSDAIH
jgi:hypothetical protein